MRAVGIFFWIECLICGKRVFIYIFIYLFIHLLCTHIHTYIHTYRGVAGGVGVKKTKKKHN